MSNTNSNTKLLCILLLASTALAAPSTTYTVVPSYSAVQFTVSEFGITHQEGLFRDFTGEIGYDAEHPELSHVEITVQSASVDTRNETRNRAVRGANLLDSDKYPTLSFVSTRVVPAPNDPSLLNVTGKFTLHGVTHELTVLVHFLGEKAVPANHHFAGFETTFKIDRGQYGVQGGIADGAIGKDVTIHLTIGADHQG